MTIWTEIGIAVFSLAWTAVLVNIWQEITAIRRMLVRAEENAVRTGRRA